MAAKETPHSSASAPQHPLQGVASTALVPATPPAHAPNPDVLRLHAEVNSERAAARELRARAKVAATELAEAREKASRRKTQVKESKSQVARLWQQLHARDALLAGAKHEHARMRQQLDEMEQEREHVAGRKKQASKIDRERKSSFLDERS